MKILRNILIALPVVFGSFSCNYLDVVPDQIATLDNAFSDRNTTLRYLASCYWAMPRSGWYGNPAWCGAMEMIVNKTLSATYQPMQLGMGLDNATVPLINYWSHDPGLGTDGWPRSLYAGIRECNTLLENIEQVGDLPIGERNRMIAEAKMLKAYMHFYLLCMYGPICPLRESLPVGEAVEAPRREKVDDCFRYVIKLMDDVIESDALPNVITAKNTELGRFTRAAAYAFRAKALVYWASPLFNENTAYNSFLDHNGEPFFNQVYDAERWTKAAEACRQALDACAEGGVRLYEASDYRVQGAAISDTTLQLQVLRSALGETWYTNPEIIWGNFSSSMGGIVWACMPRFSANETLNDVVLSVPFSTVDLFYSNHGVPIEEDKEWTANGMEKYNNRFTTRTGDAAHRYYIEPGENTAAMNFDREPRFYSSLGFDRGRWYGNYYVQLPDNNAPVLKGRWGEPSAGYLPHAYNCTGYYPKKMVNLATMYEGNGFMSVEYAADFRYADLLLLYIEALNETAASENARPDAEVYRLLDQLRTRAGLEGIEDSYAQYTNKPAEPSTKAGMRNIIRRERNIELALEGHYYWDCRRWRTAEKELNRAVRGWNTLESTEAEYYRPIRLYDQKFSQRDYLSPLPEGDIIKNPRLKQNPGY
ncbi:MAG: RagB/SusD family nutrient uptake outer membrane protein [Bacteroidales bacterium]|jgi:hypothetical protein|nr:RagB/SusD family nutrient uptake outer membrane protein [Bacteroidales bacterium]